jgi:chromosome segregation ATPase
VRDKKLEELKSELLKYREEVLVAKAKLESIQDSVKSIYIHVYRLEERADGLDHRANDLASDIRYLERRLNEIAERLEKLEERISRLEDGGEKGEEK